MRLDPCPRTPDLIIREIDDVLAADDAQLSARHPDLRHGIERDVEIVGCEFVGDRRNRESEHGSPSARNTRLDVGLGRRAGTYQVAVAVGIVDPSD